MRLTVKAWDNGHKSNDYQTIVNTFDKIVKVKGLDYFESRLDILCLEIADKLGYVFEREGEELIFLQRGLE